MVTEKDETVSPAFHDKEPVNPVAVNNELPQLFATAIPGAGGMATGAATLLVAGLVHPFTV